jgi:uncharacterized membrane protein
MARLSSAGTWVTWCTIAGAALRLFRIGRQNLWIDETISLHFATRASDAQFWKGLLYDMHGPFTTVLLRGWIQLGQSEAWMRLLYAIPGILTIPLAYRLGLELFGAKTGRIACLLLALSPFHVWYSQEIRGYSWAILWVTAALILYLRVRDGRGRAGTWVSLGTALLLGLLSNSSVALLLVALTVDALLHRPISRRFALGWFAIAVCVGLAFTPWLIDWSSRMRAERMFVNAAAPVEGVPLREASGLPLGSVPYLLWTFSYGYTLGPSLLELHLDRSFAALARHWPVLVVGALAVAHAGLAGVCRARARGRGRFVAAVLLVPLALAAFLALREIKTFHPRYLISSFPVFLALLAAGWSDCDRLAKLTSAATFVLILMSLGQHYFDPAYAREDSRAAALLILDNEQPGDSVVVIYSVRPFRHYFAGTSDGKARLVHAHKKLLRTNDELRALIAGARSESERVWLVLSRWWEVGSEERILTVFREELREKGEWRFHGVTVLLYEGG